MRGYDARSAAPVQSEPEWREGYSVSASNLPSPQEHSRW